VFVEPGSAAAEAGLRPQDLLIGIGEHDIRSLGDMYKALAPMRAGEQLKIQVVRESERHTLLLKVPSTDDPTELR